MIVQTVNVHTFREAFKSMGRQYQFSHDGLEALYELLEEVSQDTGEPFELDVISLCCDFSEDTYKDILSDYDLASFEELAGLDDDEQMELIVERLNEETIVVYHDDEKVLYQNF